MVAIKRRLILAAVAIAAPSVMIWEGVRTDAYLDIVGVPTICYGHTAGVDLGDRATFSECQALLDHELLEYVKAVDDCLGVDLKPHQLAALGSWSYNVGINAACTSTLAKKVRSGEPPESWCPEMRRWVYAGGKRVRGLVNRREHEVALCLGSGSD